MKLVIKHSDFEEYSSKWNEYDFTEEKAVNLSATIKNFIGDTKKIVCGSAIIEIDLSDVDAVCEDEKIYTLTLYGKNGMKVHFSLIKDESIVFSKLFYSVEIKLIEKDNAQNGGVKND